ncbi:MAG TPA: hypothetical protein DDX92_02825 [Flavobacteriales bacterium]|jgi:hypothetical protein|nr:hypothetical protein [Flavobacteriales bacterium]
MRVFSLFLLSIILFSCGPQAKLRRASKKIERIVAKYPELKQIDTIEQTIVVKDTFYTPAINVQDSFAYQVGDTTQRTDSATGVIVTTIIQPEYIKQFVYVPPDTLIQQDTILIRTPVERIVTKPHKKTDLDHVKNIVFWMIVIYLLIRIILKITRVNFPF